MNDTILFLIIMYCIMVGFFGTLCLGLSYDCDIDDCNIIRLFLKRLHDNFNIVGCIIICILFLPAIIFTLIAELIWAIVRGTVMLFIKIFGKDF